MRNLGARRYAELALTLVFALCVAVQANDPDPVRWAAIYTAAMVVCLFGEDLPGGRIGPGAVAAVALAWAATLVPGVLREAELADLVRTMKHENHAEEARELGGLLLVAGAMLFVATRPAPRYGTTMTHTVGTTTFELVRGDLTAEAVDAIVNAANSSLLGGGGVDGAIHRRGGPEILEDCRAIVARIGSCETGEAVRTRAGRLPAKSVVHTVGPVWQGGKAGEPALLARCWTRSLEVAAEGGARSIAFPAISTGVYGYPAEAAAITSLEAARDWVRAHPGAYDRVRVVLFSQENLTTWETAARLVFAG